jgi:hypothetical protein
MLFGPFATEEEDDGNPSNKETLQARVCAEGMLAPGIDPGAAEDSSFSRYEPETGFGSALFDAQMASTRSTSTSCCGMWHIAGIGGAGLPSTGIAIGSNVWFGRSLGSQPS